MIELDGSTGEGGGQILRTSLALSMCTGQPFTIERIRAKRTKPGLMRQHLTCVQAAVEVCGARVQGAELSSQTLVFEPGPVRAGDYSFNVGTAGSCTLVLQTVLPALMLADSSSRVALAGGTHNPMAPPFHFLDRSFAPLLRRLGVGIELELRRHGFYPAGGGEMSALIHPSGRLVAFDVMERGATREAYAECLAAALPRAVGQRELEALGRELGWSGDQLRTPALRQNEGPGNVLMATLACEQVSEVITVFGERGVSAERVADDLAREVRAFESGAGALGPHLADQWMLPLALALWQSGGMARFTCDELTDHSTTNMGVVERFLPVKFDAQRTGTVWKVTVAAPQAWS
ncbi:RNA 3'-terminal phosphate cyclase [Piscinibacter terrae]|uniref:RNA 3'-terminal phosphate cyclase n=1 Tax=Piscinibacter terrae TaxID=2496871 RepID=A0A3N7HK94_9BURK|nr:RNA 3'-terminal phosphate cyclase [Albitalea terrae]RQP22500.1 RNA 3'-terminal phosphate cyclase [Albitalea terrae]